MFAATSDFRSSEAASMWFWWTDPANKSQVWLYQSQWSTAILLAQDTIKAIFAKAGTDFEFNVFDSATSTCEHGSSIAMLPARGQAGSFKADDLLVTGKWSRATADSIGFILCQTGDSAGARNVANDIIAGRISVETVRAVLWLAFFVRAADIDLAAAGSRVSASARAAGSGIQIDTNTTLPITSTTPGAPTGLERWWTRSLRGSPIPLPGGGTRPWPTTMNRTVNNTTVNNNTTDTTGQPPSTGSSIPWMLIGLGGVALWLFMGKKGPRELPEPPAPAEFEPEPMELQEPPMEGLVVDVEGPDSFRVSAHHLLEGPKHHAKKKRPVKRSLNALVQQALSHRHARPKKVAAAVAYGKRMHAAGKSVSIAHAKDLGYRPEEARLARKASMMGRR